MLRKCMHHALLMIENNHLLRGQYTLHSVQVVMLDAAQSAGLDQLATSVTAAVGAPHNYSAQAVKSTSTQPAHAATADANDAVTSMPVAATATAEAAAPAAEAAQQPKMTEEQVRTKLHLVVFPVGFCCKLHGHAQHRA